MIQNIILVAAFWILYFIIVFGVHYIKEDLAWQPKPYTALDQYPWICETCLMTWVLIASYISIGIIINNPLFAIFGTLLGAGTGIARKYTEKERMGNDED